MDSDAARQDKTLQTPRRLPLAVDMRVVGQCNLRCPFCFGPRHEIRSTDIRSAVQLLNQLYEHGTRRIVVTGGEPLLIPRLDVLLSEAKITGFEVILSTNSTLVAKRHKQILPHVDWIALPIEAPNVQVHEACRPGTVESYKSFFESFSLVRRLYPEVRIKVGTVVSPANADLVSKLPETLHPHLGAPDIWKIYQISNSSYGADNRESLAVDNEVFERIIADAEGKAKEYQWPVVVYRNSERNERYLFIEPNGDAMVIANNAETVIGNFYCDFDGVLENWTRFVNQRLLAENSLRTYPTTKLLPQ
jgi:organic radical activating enzyme